MQIDNANTVALVVDGNGYFQMQEACARTVDRSIHFCHRGCGSAIGPEDTLLSIEADLSHLQYMSMRAVIKGREECRIIYAEGYRDLEGRMVEPFFVVIVILCVEHDDGLMAVWIGTERKAGTVLKAYSIRLQRGDFFFDMAISGIL